jgi:hypothetical protein
MAKGKFITTPTDFQGPKSGYKGGKGTYDGEPNYPKRTSSPNGVPEKTFDGNPATGKKEIVYESPVKGEQK